MTSQAGISFTYRNGEEAGLFTILESLGGGVALFDYDGDGLLDVFFTGGGYFDGPDKKQVKGHPSKLYRNLGSWKFHDVTAAAGLDQAHCYTYGCAVADYDRDGWPDLLVTGWGRLALYHNTSDGHGGRRFVDVTASAGLTDPLWSTSAAWGDLDGDGFADLYVCHYVNWSFANDPPCERFGTPGARDVCPPKRFAALPHTLYRNNRDGTFTDVSRATGLRGPRAAADYDSLTHLSPEAKARLRAADTAGDFGKGLGAVIVDVDGDRRPDVFVANDTTGNFLYLNRSTTGKIALEEAGAAGGVAWGEGGIPQGSMGVAAADYDGSGRPSLFVTNYENEMHALYRNLGAGLFQFSTEPSGIAAIGRNYVGFGTAFLDHDNDGWEDLAITNGHAIRFPVGCGLRQRPVLLRNQGNKHFVNITSDAGPYFQADHLGRGLATGDLDNDGWPDLVIVHLNEPVAVLRNNAERTAPGHHWLGIELLADRRADLAAAKVVVHAGGRRLTRFRVGGGSYLSAGAPRFLVGLGRAQQIDRLSVLWPSGRQQQWHGEALRVDRYWRLAEGDDIPRPAGGAVK